MSNCQIWTCTYNCCMADGLCPYIQSDCFYFYPAPYVPPPVYNGIPAGIIVGIAIACLVFTGFVVAFVAFLCRRHRRNKRLVEYNNSVGIVVTPMGMTQQPIGVYQGQPQYGQQLQQQQYGQPIAYGRPLNPDERLNLEQQITMNMNEQSALENPMTTQPSTQRPLMP